MEERKTCLITGGSRGIGRNIALVMAKKGYNIAINYYSDRELAEAENVKKEVEEFGVKGICIKCDVSKEDEVVNLISAVVNELSGLDVLINNAGITRDGLFVRMKTEEFQSVLDTNLLGTFLCSREAAKVMMKKRAGKIINMASIVGMDGNSGQTNYSASKAGVIGLTKSMAKELAGRNINVNAIAPGFIATEMTDKLPNKELIEERIPMHKFGTGEDVAELAAFLASDGASYITGQVIRIDGGLAI